MIKETSSGPKANVVSGRRAKSKKIIFLLLKHRPLIAAVASLNILAIARAFGQVAKSLFLKSFAKFSSPSEFFNQQLKFSRKLAENQARSFCKTALTFESLVLWANQ